MSKKSEIKVKSAKLAKNVAEQNEILKQAGISREDYLKYAELERTQASLERLQTNRIRLLEEEKKRIEELNKNAWKENPMVKAWDRIQSEKNSQPTQVAANYALALATGGLINPLVAQQLHLDKFITTPITETFKKILGVGFGHKMASGIKDDPEKAEQTGLLRRIAKGVDGLAGKDKSEEPLKKKANSFLDSLLNIVMAAGGFLLATTYGSDFLDKYLPNDIIKDTLPFAIGGFILGGMPGLIGGVGLGLGYHVIKGWWDEWQGKGTEKEGWDINILGKTFNVSPDLVKTAIAGGALGLAVKGGLTGMFVGMCLGLAGYSLFEIGKWLGEKAANIQIKLENTGDAIKKISEQTGAVGVGELLSNIVNDKQPITLEEGQKVGLTPNEINDLNEVGAATSGAIHGVGTATKSIMGFNILKNLTMNGYNSLKASRLARWLTKSGTQLTLPGLNKGPKVFGKGPILAGMVLNLLDDATKLSLDIYNNGVIKGFGRYYDDQQYRIDNEPWLDTILGLFGPFTGSDTSYMVQRWLKALHVKPGVEKGMQALGIEEGALRTNYMEDVKEGNIGPYIFATGAHALGITDDDTQSAIEQDFAHTVYKAGGVTPYAKKHMTDNFDFVGDDNLAWYDKVLLGIGGAIKNLPYLAMHTGDMIAGAVSTFDGSYYDNEDVSVYKQPEKLLNTDQRELERKSEEKEKREKNIEDYLSNISTNTQSMSESLKDRNAMEHNMQTKMQETAGPNEMMINGMRYTYSPISNTMG